MFYLMIKCKKGYKMASMGKVEVNVKMCEEIEVVKCVISDGCYLPIRAHDTDAGFDLRTPKRVIIPAHGSAVIDTGVSVEIPKYFYGKLESKSGLMCKHDVVCPGGVIDCGYTGTIAVKLFNYGHDDYIFEKGDKIVQLLIIPCALSNVKVVLSLEDTERGDNGFGSTGK